MKTPTVFVSYSHDSPEHADRVLEFADQLRNDGIDAVLDQYESSPPEGWHRCMDTHIRNSDFVVMVCTETYFRRVMGEEEPGKGLGVRWEGNLIYQHIYNAGTMNTRFIPVLFDHCRFEHIPTPLQGATHYAIHTERGYEELYRRLTDQPRTKKPELGKLKSLPTRERKQDYLGPRVSLAKLPSTSPDLYGREKELEILDKAWEDPRINVLSLVAFGGVGKTALVGKWLTKMGVENYRKAERVYGWSFYSQGAAEGRQVSADPFIAAALEWFGDPDPNRGSPWDKGERLAELIRKQRTLLILDGLEPLQNPPPVETGRVKDPGLCALLRELARQNPGLLVITTRLTVDDLKDFVGSTVRVVDLEDLSNEAGAAYLGHLGVKESTEELEKASSEFGGHALALTLLGTYLATVYNGDVRQRDKIERLTDEKGKGAHARRMMEAYEKWFEGKPELDILRLMGLFDKPAEAGALKTLRKEPTIEGLTDQLKKITHADWQYALKSLRDARLLSKPDPNEPETLDCHPLLREHFAEKLKETNPKAWREAHSRLYEYYKSIAKDLPETFEEMTHLYQAVTHGCLAGRYQNTLDDIVRPRILRGDMFFSSYNLGAFSSDLAALSGFYEPPELWGKPVAQLNAEDGAYVDRQVGYNLRTLGRLREAVVPLTRALEFYPSVVNNIDAVRTVNILCRVYLMAGDLQKAKEYATLAVTPGIDSGESILKLRTLGYVLTQLGATSEARNVFEQAHKILMETGANRTTDALLDFEYCELLLDAKDFDKVETIMCLVRNKYPKENYHIGSAMRKLTRVRLNLLICPAISGYGDSLDCSPSLLDEMNEAMSELRSTSHINYLPRGLLARAELHRVTGATDMAKRDLDEAFSIATRGGMRLHEADCRLGYARLYLALGDIPKARESRDQAKKLIEEMGYHRRDGEVKELEEQL